MSKVFVLGIDGAPPELVFDKWLEELPTVKNLIKNGSHAKLNSAIPPSTIAAWNSMLSGKDPSELGIFSFTYKNEKGETKIVDSTKIKCDRVWDILSKSNKKSIVLYIPLTYPVTPLNGIMVSDFLALGLDKKSTYPLEISNKIKAMDRPDLFFDVAVGLSRYKSIDTQELIDNVYKMTEMQLKLAKDLIINQEWDLFISVMMGTDRLQHMLWRHFDKTHRRYIPNSPHQDVLKKYYIYLDQQLAEIIKLLPLDTTIIVVSDHGFIKQEGKINLNNWLIEKGYLNLKKDILPKTAGTLIPFKFEFIDWENTFVYSAGAYHARLFLNKDKLGNDYVSFREKLIRELKAIPDDHNKPLETTVYKKEDIYRYPDNPECPDLTVYFDDLRWASDPNLGQSGIYSWESAVGADNAGHSRQGIFICNKKITELKNKEIDIKQIFSLILNFTNK